MKVVPMIKFNLDGKVQALGIENPKGIIKTILHEICRLLEIKGNHVISYIIVDNDEIHQINLTYRGIDRATESGGIIAHAHQTAFPGAAYAL